MLDLTTSWEGNPAVWHSPVPYPVSLEQRALAFFTSRYIILEPDGEAEPIGYLQCLPTLLKAANTDGCMYRSVYAAALSALARDRRDPQLLVQARKQYATALSRTNLALTDAKQALLDETLMAVHVLGIFETTMSTTKDLSPWLNHIMGSATLIQMRGSQIFETSAGTGLFHLNQGQMAICSLATRKDMFKFVPTLETQRRKGASIRRSLDIIFEIPGVLEELDHLASDANPDPSLFERATQPLLEKAARIDVELEEWLLTLPPLWKPILSISSDVLPPASESMPAPFLACADGLARAEQYVNIWIICIINFARAGRIVLLLTHWSTLQRLDILLPPSSHRSAEIQSLKRIIQSEVDSICTTVASTLGCQVDHPLAFHEDMARQNAQALGGFFLLWPIWSAIEVPFLPPEQASWLTSWRTFITDARELVSLSF
jgi:hypothetical protein